MRELPETVTVSVPEGFAYYALYPEMYRIAAREFAREQRPRAAVVIGIRSIGAALAAVVAEELPRTAARRIAGRCGRAATRSSGGWP